MKRSHYVATNVTSKPNASDMALPSKHVLYIILYCDNSKKVERKDIIKVCENINKIEC